MLYFKKFIESIQRRILIIDEDDSSKETTQIVKLALSILNNQDYFINDQMIADKLKCLDDDDEVQQLIKEYNDKQN